MTAPTRPPVVSNAVWHSGDVRRSDWTFTLSDGERDEIVEAAQRVAGATTSSLARDAFPLPTVEQRLVDWEARLTTGPGFVLLRGFPVDRLSEHEVELAYVGLGLHLGTPVSQNAAGDLLGHVRDERRAGSGPAVRLYTTNKRQDFHTDGSDLVGLLCLRRAKAGGESRIASSLAVYNEMLARRPDLVEELYRPLPWDRNDEQSPGEAPFFELPAFVDLDGTPRIFYIGWYIRDSQRHPDAPRLTEPQIEALALIEAIANDPAFSLAMEFRPGDIQLLNNARILHSREAYEDHEDPAQRRHLLRLWLTAHRYSTVEGVLQGGIPARRGGAGSATSR